MPDCLSDQWLWNVSCMSGSRTDKTADRCCTY